MIITIARYRFDEVHTLSQAWMRMSRHVARDETTPGLMRKYYLLGDDGMVTGGIYVWRTREAAEEHFAKRPGPRATVEYFRVPVAIGDCFEPA